MRKVIRVAAWLAVLLSTLSMSGCSGNIGVGVSVGVPIGSHGYMSVGTGRWY